MGEKRFIVVQERSDGNAETGNAWLETRCFPPTATLEDVWKWKNEMHGHGGRTILTLEHQPYIPPTNEPAF